MDWKELLKSEIEYTYAVTEKLLDMVDDSTMDWKPETGDNWMSVGNLLMHITTSCGVCFKGFVTGDWGMPDEVDLSELKPEDMLPPAEAMPKVGKVAESKQLLAEDKILALEMLGKSSNEQLSTQTAPAPWDPSEVILGQRLLGMVGHLAQHKTQLFYYLKLQGKPVNTGDLWGMG